MKNRFGMFIHWGIYSLTGYHEQALSRGGMDHEEYEKLASRFDPVLYDPDKWVLLAKNAGMKYICFTAKHHDGFCMWDTKQTDYNIMNTPYGRDTLKLLAEACRRHGMALSIYYSIPDWHHPLAFNPLSTHQEKAKYPERSDMPGYIEYIKAQVRELLTNYGEIYTFFWDIPPHIYDPSVNELVRSLQPGILINDRGFDGGDFATPERTVPEGSRFASMTEACQSVGSQSWGYREEEDYFSSAFLMSSIDKIMAMGGSYLLNVGPTAEGIIPEKAESIVSAVGGWYNRVSEGLEDTEASFRQYHILSGEPFVAADKDGYTYFHFHNGLTTGAVTFTDTDLPDIRSAVLCNTGKELKIRFGTLPMRLDADHVARTKYLSLRDIPVDELAGEPVVIRVRWKK